jgi:hypothetical protein
MAVYASALLAQITLRELAWSANAPAGSGGDRAAGMFATTCHHPVMFGWKRMGTLSPRAVLAGFGVAGGALATAKVIASAIGNQSAIRGLPIFGFLCLWMIAAYRIMRIGLYASKSDLRVRTVLRTQTISWSAVSSIDVVQDSLSRRDRISIALASGRLIMTPVCRRGSLVREVFSSDSGLMWTEPEFDQVLAQLRHALTQNSTTLPPAIKR